MYNPYVNPFGYVPPMNQNVLPQQQITQVNGKASVDTIQLAPNSSILVMDTSAPIVWMCVSDGIGKVTATPYDIVLHKDEPKPDISSIEKRLSAIENTLAEMENRNDKSYDAKPKPKQNSTGDQNYKNYGKPRNDDSPNATV